MRINHAPTLNQSPRWKSEKNGGTPFRIEMAIFIVTHEKSCALGGGVAYWAGDFCARQTDALKL
jgi:hypothetical protein